MAEGPAATYASPEGLGALLRQARADAGLSQTALAQRTGIAQPNISAYESGVRTPTVRTLLALLDACGARLLLSRTAPDAEPTCHLDRDTQAPRPATAGSSSG